MDGHNGSTADRRPGRCGDARAHRAILDAALAVFAEVGLERMSIDAVARRAGVGKATIYLRWDSKEELVCAALDSLRRDVAIPDTGSLRGDLDLLRGEALRLSGAPAPGGAVPRLWGAVVAAAISNRRFVELYWACGPSPGRRAFARVLERAVARGELRPDLDVDVAIDLIAGALIYRILINPTPMSLEDYLAQVVETIWRGLAAPPT
jgi:AcrR family transcriptional regulator